MSEQTPEELSKHIAEQTAKLDAALARLEARGAEAPPEGEGQKVPYSRLKRYVDENKVLRDSLESLTGQVSKLQQAQQAERDKIAAAAEERAKKLQEEATSQLTALQSQMQQKVDLVRLGLDDEDGVDALRTAYKRLPEENRPESVVDYYKAMIDGQKALAENPEAEVIKPPRTLLAYMPEIKVAEPDRATRARRGPTSTEVGTKPRRRVSVAEIKYDPDKGFAAWASELDKANA